MFFVGINYLIVHKACINFHFGQRNFAFIYYIHLSIILIALIFLLACTNSYVERLLDRISNGVLAEDRRTAMAELQSVVAESHAAKMAFGVMGMCFFSNYVN